MCVCVCFISTSKMDDEKPPMQQINDQNSIANNGQFICGVVEGSRLIY